MRWLCQRLCIEAQPLCTRYGAVGLGSLLFGPFRCSPISTVVPLVVPCALASSHLCRNRNCCWGRGQSGWPALQSHLDLGAVVVLAFGTSTHRPDAPPTIC